MAASVVACDSAHRLAAREARAGGGADFLIDNSPSRDRKTEPGPSRENLADIIAGSAGNFCRGTRSAAAWKKSDSSRGQRYRHHARARCVGVDVD